jgi:mono/diheme cytochrome c family protein
MLGNASVTLDTAKSATAYYAAIDPQQQRTTLLDWFKVNGFLAGSSTTVRWADVATGSAAHAVYTNNFDLGFGRDMYAKVGECDDGAAPALGGPLEIARVGRCDTAAVVINYSSLEGAAKKLNPVLAVAMEYRATPGSGGRRIVQFYTFAPDLVNGEFRRVFSANLDGRGEKFMPQVCTVCHGGAPGGLDANGAYGNAGDVNAVFLPWDLDALLYADASGANADPSFSEESLRPQYTRSAQADSLRKLNQIAYLTFQDTTRPTRHVLVRQLVDGWYGAQAGPPAQAFVNAAFDGTYTPAGWTANGVDGMPGTADDNPASAPALYHDVFARNCRACHVVQAPAPKASGDALELISDNNGTYNKCDASEPAGEAAWTGAPNQLPIGCYRQFVTARNLAQRLSEGRMPFARLTMDRFWVGPDATSSAGDELFDHLTEVYAALPAERRPVLTVPGTASACFTGLGASFSSASAGTDAEIEPGIDYPLDGSCSLFAQQYHWTLLAPSGSTASLVYEDSKQAVLRGVDLKGEYTLTLATAPNVTAQAKARRIDRPIVLPVIDAATLSPATGENVRDVLVNASGGDRGLAIATVTSANTGVIDAAIASANSIRLTAHAVSSSPIVISYTVADGDGDTAPGQFDANVKAELTANSFPATPAKVRRTGAAGTSVPIDLSEHVVGAAGQPLKYSVSPATRAGSDGQPGSVSVDEATGMVSYTPPQGVMSQFRSGAGLAVLTEGAVSLHDTFTYSVSYASDPGTTRTGTVTVALEGNDTDNVSFASLYDGDLRTSCGGCHGTNTGFVAPKWFDPGSDRTTFCHMRQDSTGNDPAVPYANRADPAASALYTRPTGELGHPTLNVPALRQLVLDWIAEGANFTSDPDQLCQ